MSNAQGLERTVGLAEIQREIDSWKPVLQAKAEQGIQELLKAVGEDPTRSGLTDTPERVVKAFLEMTCGYKQDPAQILGRTFEDSYDEVVIVRNIAFTSLCEHHLLPFLGSADVGYIPGKVVGLSKIPRLVDCFACRLQMQERLTRQIAEAIEKHLEARGVAVVIRGSHSCMGCRGVKKPGAEMVTSVTLGMFRDNASARSEFLALLSR